jgi:putative NADH-flavin reductase
MEIAVLGATGRTGMRVVEQALGRGHRVAALARAPEALTMHGDGLVTARADVLDPAALDRGLAGAEAVISAVGVGTSRAPTSVYSRGVANVLGAMAAHGIRRLAVISAAPVALRDRQPFLERRIAMPILERVFGETYDDMRRMEALLRESTVDWTSLRPPRLVDREPRGAYRLSADGPLPRARSLTHGDLAAALLDVVERADLHGRAAFVAN